MPYRESVTTYIRKPRPVTMSQRARKRQRTSVVVYPNKTMVAGRSYPKRRAGGYSAEVKNFDCADSGTITTTVFYLAPILNAVPLGDGESNRQGRSLRAKNLKVRLTVSAQQNTTYRVIIFIDRQPTYINGAIQAPTWQTVIEDKAFPPSVVGYNKDQNQVTPSGDVARRDLMFRKLDFSNNRYVFLKDKSYTINPATDLIGGEQGLVPQTQHKQWYINLKNENVKYRDVPVTDNQFANPPSYAIRMFILTEGATTTLPLKYEWCSRFDFSDK